MKNNFLTFLLSALGQDPSKKFPKISKQDRIAIKQQRRERRGSSATKNKSVGESKDARKRAALSNKINRKRCHRWKH